MGCNKKATADTQQAAGWTTESWVQDQEVAINHNASFEIKLTQDDQG
ncbi:hypothetical protein B481_0229 [Planococcus halocryophilus Or1]|nr:hypothetical protein [Planococcus halocryophilus]EMF48111.1 hypothetical protein B481_0229 [Planococcus halocryophilus Or1]